MTQVSVKYNPYKLETELKVNGRPVSTDSVLYKNTKGKRLQEWVGTFPQVLKDELNTIIFSVEFCGMDLDWDDFNEAFQQAVNKAIIKRADMKFIVGKSNEDITEQIVRTFEDLKAGPIPDFPSKMVLNAFDNVNNSVFPINVIATMSSGKSTLINALLGSKLMPYKTEACTATIMEILDTDKSPFTAITYNEAGDPIEVIENLTYEVMVDLNDDDEVCRIEAEGNIPFLDAKSTALKLVDTPGPNNARTSEHRNTTYRAIENSSNNLILYVLNGTQLGTEDDASLLQYVAEQIKKGGKQVRDRFMFVINKMDQFNPEEESIEKAIQAAKDYLAKYGIDDPQLFPCSAFTALNIRTYFDKVDIENLTRAEERKLPLGARDTLPMIDKFLDYESMHLEKYTTLSPSAQQELEYRLREAENAHNIKEQALIHSGICSIESAIQAYVKKYAKTKKVKDLVDTFDKELRDKQVLANARQQVATDREAAKECAERAAIINQKIADGAEAKTFKGKIDALDPMPQIREQAELLKHQVGMEVNRVFVHYGERITSRDEAKRLIKTFADTSADSMAKLTANLDSMIRQEIVETGESLLTEYQEKLAGFDDSVQSSHLDFKTVDLVSGALNSMRQSIENTMATDEFASETVEDIGETTYDEKKYYEKVGQEEEEVVVGYHQEKIGTKKVKVGSHREWKGTKQVKNPEKRWWKFLTPKYIEKAVYEKVDDYKDEDVYKTVTDYKTIIRDVFEERTERIEKFSVKLSDLHRELFSKMRMRLDEGVDSALDYAAEQVDNMKAQFKDMFDMLDKVIADKYNELNMISADQEKMAEKMAENQKILEWLEACVNEINTVLDI